jgi:predicted nucleic acid-binding Zn ribbon protein
MSRRAPRRLADAIGDLAGQLAPKTPLADVQRVWATAAGPVIAKEATPTTERDGTLTLACRSSVWAQELDLMGPELIERINAQLGGDRITALRCVASPSRSWVTPEA